MLRGILIASVCATLVGCNAADDQSNVQLTFDPGRTWSTVFPDPLTSFKRIVEDGMKRAAEDKDKLETPHNPAYDVRKTDSLVSPYTATLTFAGQKRADGKDFAEYKLDYAFQEKKWVLKSSEVSLAGMTATKFPDLPPVSYFKAP